MIHKIHQKFPPLKFILYGSYVFIINIVRTTFKKLHGLLVKHRW